MTILESQCHSYVFRKMLKLNRSTDKILRTLSQARAVLALEYERDFYKDLAETAAQEKWKEKMANLKQLRRENRRNKRKPKRRKRIVQGGRTESNRRNH